MNDDLIYHQIETGGCRPVIAEFLIYDFRFWYDVEAGSRTFELWKVSLMMRDIEKTGKGIQKEVYGRLYNE